ncbi:hypothetical protein PORY_000285 [Pneumocystis oryctolagi]|uniref:Uncharacterized protein n=1 Tax=Pneumocystis oryctolagi TaxID=42067 RepID=A0ACB7CHH0_9ASCO|nr:hypothetical protein PORY_000285 [Pneumocystis oryctolagi]
MRTIDYLIQQFYNLRNNHSYHFYSTLKESFSKGMVRLSPNRQLIEICGTDANKFLQSMISNNVPKQEPGIGVFAGFFLPQGRILCDVFIYPVTHNTIWRNNKKENYNEGEQAFFIECDSNSAKNLMDHLKRYKLRSKLSFRLIDNDEWSVWASWGVDIPNNYQKTEIIGCYDNRAPELGRRDILPGNTKPEFEVDEIPPENYKIRRYLYGVPEGPDEIFENISFPIESCIDYMGGIDFYKGCYIGQELTTRIYHTGIVRKRIVPISLYDFNDSPPSILEYAPSTEINIPPMKANIIVRQDAKEKNIGKFCSGIGNIGLGLMRLDNLFNKDEKQRKCIINYVDKNNNNCVIGVKAFQPWWWPQKQTNQ